MDGCTSSTVKSCESSFGYTAEVVRGCHNASLRYSVSPRSGRCCCRRGASVEVKRHIGHLTLYVLLTFVCGAVTCKNFHAIAVRLLSKSCEPTHRVRNADLLPISHTLNSPMASRLSGVGDEGGNHLNTAAAVLQQANRLPGEFNVTYLLKGWLPAEERALPQLDASATVGTFGDDSAAVHIGKSGFESGTRGETFNWNVMMNSSSSSGPFAYSKGRVKIQTSGHYFVYAQVGFLMWIGGEQRPTKAITYDLMITRNTVKTTLARGGISFCWMRQFALQSSFVGRVAHLRRNDELYVHMSDPENAWHERSRTFFGAYLLADRVSPEASYM